MSARARTSWRLSADGQYVRQICWTTSRTGRRTQVKFRLGANRKETMRGDEIIRRRWDQLEEQGGAVVWTEEALTAAKAAAATAAPSSASRRIRTKALHNTSSGCRT